MTIEQTRNVAVPAAVDTRLALLTKQYLDAQKRFNVGGLGDRTEVIRAEQLATQIEASGYDQLLNPVPVSDSTTSIPIYWPFAIGAPIPSSPVGPESSPAEIWRSARPEAGRTEASFERFTAQLTEWVSGEATSGQQPKALCPSDIQNRALTEALRRHVGRRSGSAPVEALVTYRDGSSAATFPLQSVSISDTEPQDGREVLRMTLLSVRHVDMDVKVDGAWLRNREISLPRAAALTDQISYEQSLAQFKIVSQRGPVTLHLYQTGLASANVGFYRALINHHREPGAHGVAVVPFYFAGGKRFVRSRSPWTIR